MPKPLPEGPILELGPLVCPGCGHTEAKTLDTRGRCRRRRCLKCQRIFRTEEVPFGVLPASYAGALSSPGVVQLLLTLFAETRHRSPLLPQIASGWADLWDEMSKEQRQALRAMIVVKGLHTSELFKPFMKGQDK